MTDDDLFASIQPDEKAALARDVPEVAVDYEARFLAAVAHRYGLQPAAYQPITGRTIRLTCRFCSGRGCLICGLEQEREYHRQFPHGPVPLLTIDTTTSTGAARAAFVCQPAIMAVLVTAESPHAAQRLLEESERCAMWDGVAEAETIFGVIDHD